MVKKIVRLSYGKSNSIFNKFKIINEFNSGLSFYQNSFYMKEDEIMKENVFVFFFSFIWIMST